ncbi:hypothetical protein N0V93_002780 [Gnomoniopsis smithogilvyi]|uniref:Uncharacterized protein n=1 Tax=Gnomoniopsis smithogilvyi TaxID=1191159 RepID=A0A9W9CZ99_9PEZI|nr:hypothetical protein N0V93_002780 [Gnomoniopsis smithogilvyi]
MTSRMKLSFHLQRNRSVQDERSSQPQFQPQSIQIQAEEPIPSIDEQEQQRQASVCAANDLIRELIALEDRWSSHMSLIRVDCPHTLSELHALGNLPQSEGVAACSKLIRVPVIYEEIGRHIWTQLATVARGSNSSDDSLAKAYTSTDTQLKDGLFLERLDERFRFDKPASVSARSKLKDSPPMSPKDVHMRNYFCLPENIDEGDEGLEDSQSEAPSATRGRVSSRSGKSQPSARPDAERQRSFFSNGAGRNGSHVSLLKWSRERGTPPSASRTSSTTRDRSESLAGRLGSAVGGLGQRVAGVLVDGTSQNQSRNRSQSARSL